MVEQLQSKQDLLDQLYHSHGRLLRLGSKVLYVRNGDIYENQ